MARKRKPVLMVDDCGPIVIGCPPSSSLVSAVRAASVGPVLCDIGEDHRSTRVENVMRELAKDKKCEEEVLIRAKKRQKLRAAMRAENTRKTLEGKERAKAKLTGWLTLDI
jgi:hypothetical protein